MFNDTFNDTPRESKLLGQLSFCNLPRNVNRPYLRNYFSRCRRSTVVLASVISDTHPAFLHHVVSILFCSTKEKVVRVGTFWIIAFVKHVKSIWNWATMKQPRRTMGYLLAFSRLIPCNVAVGTLPSSFISSPSPAWSEIWSMRRNGSVFVHPLPESFRKSFGKPLRSQIFGSNLDLHQSVRLIVCHALGSSNRKGISFCIP